MALVEDVRRNADVVAVSAMRLLTLMSWDFRDALAQLPEFRRRIEDLMAKRTQRDGWLSRLRPGRRERNMPPVAKGPTTI
jgi:CRP-like cAMP-binding protein